MASIYCLEMYLIPMRMPCLRDELWSSRVARSPSGIELGFAQLVVARGDEHKNPTDESAVSKKGRFVSISA